MFPSDTPFALLGDIPSPVPIGHSMVLLAVAVAVAIGAALFVYARIVRRRSAAPPDVTAGRRPDA